MKIFTIGKADVPDCDERLNIPIQENKTYLLSIIDPDCRPPRRPIGVTENHHFQIRFHDIEQVHNDGYNLICPNKDHVAQLINFFNSIKDEAEILIVHCFAGISRSTATTFIFHCIFLGEGAEKEGVDAMIKSTVFGGARPNKLIIKLADDLLDRKGKMVYAIQEYYQQLEAAKKAWRLGDNVIKFIH